MAEITIGAEAIDRSGTGSPGYTRVNKEGPASASGTITSIDIWANENITGLRVGTFYSTNGNTLKCRASQAIAGTITAGSKVTKAVSLAVEIGDYIGAYWTGGKIDYAAEGFAGQWLKNGEFIDPGDEEVYGLNAGDAASLGGKGETPVMGGGGGPANLVAAGVI